MIKINLLRETTGATRRAWTREHSQVGVYAVILMFLAIAGTTWWYWRLLNLQSEHTAEIGQLQAENARLQAVKGQLERFERQKKLLQEKIAVIERLKANQKGPVLLMNAVIASVPAEPKLWLDDIRQRESDVSISGIAIDYTSVADFISRLSERTPFREVELNSLQKDNDQKVKFELNCRIGS